MLCILFHKTGPVTIAQFWAETPIFILTLSFKDIILFLTGTSETPKQIIHLCNTIQRAQVCLCAHRFKQILLSFATPCYFIRWTKSEIEYYQIAWCINCLWHLISMLHQITWYNSGTEKSYWDMVITLEPWKVILIEYDLNFLFPLLQMGYFFHLKTVLSMYKYT